MQVVRCRQRALIQRKWTFHGVNVLGRPFLESTIFTCGLQDSMCYYRLYVFLHCGHSTFSEMPVGFCKAAKEVSLRFSSPGRQRESTISTASDVSRADSMEPEERRKSRAMSATKAIRPCAQGQMHPLQTRRLERLCAVCQHDRDQRLQVLESLNSEIRFESWRWQFKYQGGSTSVSQRDASKEAVFQPENGSVWDVGTTFNSLMTGGSSWIKDWKRQEPSVGN